MSGNLNPYEPTSFVPTSGWTSESKGAQRTWLLERISGPAWGLIITSSIWIGLLLLAAGVNVLLIASGVSDELRPPRGMTKETQIVVRTFFGFVLMALNGLTIYGAYCLKNLRNRALAMTAIILAIVPCTSACYIVGIGFGIWALVVISKPEIWESFD